MAVLMHHHGSVLPEYSGLVDEGEANEGARIEIAAYGVQEEGIPERDHLSL